VALKAIFVRRDISEFTPHPGIPSVEDILSELHSSQLAESAVQQPVKQSTPVAHPRDAGNLRLATDILATVIGEDEARLQTREIMKRHSPDDDVEEFVEACIALAAPFVGEHIAVMMFEEITSPGG
ncbi:MAG: hypothetical protein OEM98_00660, partial [Gammaproteobacteria bacterium]|nr:hypothetical protein [Gammaproteobacteria bacterium]